MVKIVSVLNKLRKMGGLGAKIADALTNTKLLKKIFKVSDADANAIIKAASKTGTSLVPSRYAAKTLGEWGETRLGAFLNFAGTKPTKPFITKYGARYPDRLVNGIAHEAKAGLDVRLTTKIATQIAKDKELVELGLIKGAH